MNLKDLVQEALKNALENGYDEIKTQDPMEIAVDLTTNDAALESADIGEVAAEVKAWQNPAT